MKNTAFHAEFRLRDEKPPLLIEIGARLAGDLIPILVEMSTGVNMLEASLSCAVAENYEYKMRQNGVYAIRFIEDSLLLPKLRNLKKEAQAQYDIELYPISKGGGRLGHIIVKGNSIEDTEAKMNLCS